ncbi:MAG: PadR family transcriptional regulator [Thermoanaerobaculia bacterium]|nr:PadR family transcriptional regulator [Thermoanaerobaculia bacterium]
MGAVYTTLERLEGKGFLCSRMGRPTAVRGGRRKKLCRLTPAGERALSLSWDAQRKMAQGLEQVLEDLRQRASDAASRTSGSKGA